MSFVNTVDLIGDEALTNKIIDRSITEITDDLVTTLGTGAFARADKLVKANFAAAKTIGTNAFSYCTALIALDLGAAETIGTSAFYYCNKLTTLILRSTTMCALTTTGAFSASALANNKGYIYVPKSLLSDDDASKDYRRASNWSNYAARFRAIEDYPEI